MKACVTGGAGFIGTNLTAMLLEAGEQVVVVDNLSTGRRECVDRFAEYGERFRFLEGDLCDLNVAHAATEHCEVIFHQAALGSVPRSVEDPNATNENNTRAAINVMIAAAANKVRRVVYASSASVYGEGERGEDVKTETMPPRPANPYAVSKYAAEEYVKVLGRLTNVETVSLRYFNVFGPWQRPDGPYAAVVPRFVSRLLAGEPVEIHGDGKQFRDFTYVANVANANILAARAPAEKVNGLHFNVGAGGCTTVNGLYDAIVKATGADDRRLAVHVPARAGDVRGSMAGVERAWRALGYRAKVGVAEGVRRTVEWFASQS